VNMSLLLWVGVACLAAYEVWALANKPDGDTISEIVWAAAAKRPVVPFLGGLLAGHFFWRWVLVLALVLPATSVLAADLPLPDPTLTPGVARAISINTICYTKWGKDHRAVTLSMKKQVAAAYHIAWSQHAKYEFDHLISRELGGADDVKNLWPELWTGTYNAREKDRLENKLHKMVCEGNLPLATAQHEIATNWIAAYHKYVEK